MAGGTAQSPTIAIVGGGIGGLAAAAFLHREHLNVTVYEQAPELTEIGAGLVVAPNAARLLRKLGVLDDFAARAVQLEVGWEFRRWEDGRVLSAEDLSAACERLYGEHTYTAHRADLLAVIRSVVPPDSVRLGRRCVDVMTDQQRPILRFADGETIEADIVLGADGVHSVVRSAVTEPHTTTGSGICAFRALVPAEHAPTFARRRAQTLWIGPEHHLVHYPVSAGKFINLVAFAPAREGSVESWTATATVDEFLAEFEGWDARLIDLVRAAGVIGRWALIDRPPLSRWSHGRVALLGDAAHPMFPFFAQGAAQAIEDAAVLAGCLAAGLDEPASALLRYQTLRLSRTSQVQKVSHGRSLINHLVDGPEQQQRDLAFAAADPLVDNGWIYSYDPDAELAAATGTP
jgi:salicylate hydroxylase